MKSIAVVGVLTLLPAFGVMLSQQTGAPAQSPATPGPPEYVIHSGTFAVELTQTLHTAKAQIGEEVTAVLEKDLLRGGKVFAAVGSKVVGHVAEVRASSKQDHESHLRVVFDKVVSKSGNEIMFTAPAVVLAVAPDKRAIPTRASVRSGGPQMETLVFDDVGDPRSFELAVRGTRDSSVGRILTPTARGVLYMRGVKLKDDPPGLIVDKDENMILEYGTQMLITIKKPA